MDCRLVYLQFHSFRALTLPMRKCGALSRQERLHRGRTISGSWCAQPRMHKRTQASRHEQPDYSSCSFIRSMCGIASLEADQPDAAFPHNNHPNRQQNANHPISRNASETADGRSAGLREDPRGGRSAMVVPTATSEPPRRGQCIMRERPVCCIAGPT